MLALELTTAPASEPVTLAEAKLWLKVDGTADDAVIEGLITAARAVVEHNTRRQLITATYTLFLDGFPSSSAGATSARHPAVSPVRVAEIVLPRPPLSAVDTVKYLDADGAQQTLDAGQYDVDTVSEPGRLTLGYGNAWPATYRQHHAIEVQFQTGYADAAAVPGNGKTAVKMILADVYENRMAQSFEIPLYRVNPTVAALLADLVIPEVW